MPPAYSQAASSPVFVVGPGGASIYPSLESYMGMEITPQMMHENMQLVPTAGQSQVNEGPWCTFTVLGTFTGCSFTVVGSIFNFICDNLM